MADDNNLNITRYLSATVVISVLAQISTFTYYNEFGFNPIGYFELTEMIFASAKDFILLSTFMYILFQTLGVNIRPGSFRFINTKQPIKSKVLSFLNDNYLSIQFHVGNAILITIFYIQRKPYSPFLYSSLFVLLMDLLRYNNNKYYTIRENDPEHFEFVKSRTPMLNYFLASIGAIYISIAMALASIKASRAKNENVYIGSHFILQSNEKILATSKALLIGRSKDYIFIYNTPDSSLRVIKRSDIVKEVLKNSSKSFTYNVLFSY